MGSNNLAVDFSLLTRFFRPIEVKHRNSKKIRQNKVWIKIVQKNSSKCLAG